MNYVVADGKSNCKRVALRWSESFLLISGVIGLEGMILTCKSCDLQRLSEMTSLGIGLYVIIAVAFWFYPGMFGLGDQ